MIRDHYILPVLNELGWIREETKGQWEPAQEAEVLGLVVNLVEGRFFIPAAKLERLQEVATVQEGQWFSRRELAAVTGFLASLSRAALIMQLFLRSSYALIGGGRDWDRLVVITSQVVDDLSWIKDNLHKWHGAPMWRPSRVLVLQTDASGKVGWGAALKARPKLARGYHKEEEIDWEINIKELYTVLMGILSFREIIQGRMLECQVDSSIAQADLANGGGPNVQMNDLVKRIHLELASIGASLYEAIWIKGSLLNQKADQMSHWRDQDNWELAISTVELLRQVFGPWDVDQFADQHNAKAPVFNSLFYTPGTAAVDAFSQDWGHVMNLLVPPLYLVMRVLQHLIKDQAQGILVVPRWEAQPWWPLLCKV